MRHKTVGSKFVHTERENVTKYIFFVSGSQHGSWQDSAPARKVMLEDRAGKHGHDDPRDKVETFKLTRLKYCTEFCNMQFSLFSLSFSIYPSIYFALLFF